MERRLEEEFSRSRRYGIPLAILLIDIDHFKHVNDTYGHQNGDCVLIQLGQLISRTIRDSDIAARYGGEEFLVIAPHTTALNAVTLGSRLRQQMESHEFSINDGQNGNKEVHLTISIGIAEFGPGTADVNMLVRCADEALYRAKREGRNRVIVGAPSLTA